MTKSSLQRRIVALEREILQLRGARRARARSKGRAPGKNWRRTIGMFTNDSGMQQLFQEAMSLRETNRAKARGSTRRRKTR